MLIFGLLTGCAPQPTAAPAATPKILQVETTSGLDWLRTEMAECVQQSQGLSLSVQTIALPEQSLNKADFLIRWSDQPVAEGLAFELGQEKLAVIVHPDNPLETIDLSMVKDIYYGQVTEWPGIDTTPGESIHPWVFPADSEAQALFEQVVISNTQIIRTAKIAPSPAAMLEAVGDDPQSIGILPARWLDETVKPIEIIGYTKDNLTMPILAITSIEPTGLTRDWLLCVQDRVYQ